MVGGLLLIRLRRILTHVLFRLRQAAPKAGDAWVLDVARAVSSAIARDRVFLFKGAISAIPEQGIFVTWHEMN